jgi:hypothetical protein
MPDTIIGIDGTVYNTSDIVFDSISQTFTVGQLDISTNLYRKDQLLWQNAGFDVTAYNNLLYTHHYEATHGGKEPPVLGSTSTLSNFFTDITTDPLSAPLDSLNKGVKQVFASTGIETLILVGLGGLVLFLIVNRELK